MYRFIHSMIASYHWLSTYAVIVFYPCLYFCCILLIFYFRCAYVYRQLGIQLLLIQIDSDSNLSVSFQIVKDTKEICYLSIHFMIRSYHWLFAFDRQVSIQNDFACCQIAIDRIIFYTTKLIHYVLLIHYFFIMCSFVLTWYLFL